MIKLRRNKALQAVDYKTLKNTYKPFLKRGEIFFETYDELLLLEKDVESLIGVALISPKKVGDCVLKMNYQTFQYQELTDYVLKNYKTTTPRAMTATDWFFLKNTSTIFDTTIIQMIDSQGCKLSPFDIYEKRFSNVFSCFEEKMKKLNFIVDCLDGQNQVCKKIMIRKEKISNLISTGKILQTVYIQRILKLYSEKFPKIDELGNESNDYRNVVYQFYHNIDD